MIKCRVLCLMSLALPMILSGCSRSGEITVSEPICLSAMSKAKVMQVAEEVLTSMQFVIDKYDVDAGFLKTRYLRGSQFFEFWRSDNASREAGSFSNIHSVQRMAMLDVIEDSGRVCLECEVYLRRLSMEEKEHSRMDQPRQ